MHTKVVFVFFFEIVKLLLKIEFILFKQLKNASTVIHYMVPLGHREPIINPLRLLYNNYLPMNDLGTKRF